MFSRSANFSILQLGLDLACLILAVFAASWIRLNLPLGIPLEALPGIPGFLSLAITAYLLIFLALSVYTPDRYFTPAEEFRLLAAACLVGGLTLSGLLYFTLRDTSRLFLVEFILVHTILIFGWRGLFFLRRRQPGQNPLAQTRVLAAGSGEAIYTALQKLEDLNGSHLQVVGYLTISGQPLPNYQLIPCLGGFSDASRLVNELNVDNLLIALPPSEYTLIQGLVNSLVETACSLWVVPDYYNLLIYGAHVRNLGSLPMISLRSPTLTPNQRLFKRIFDVLVSSLALLFLAPLLLCAAAAIYLETGRPVLLKMPRAGENGKVFGMYKFRSMVQDAEKRQAEVIQTDATGHILHKNPNDPRITPVGRILRRTSIDELPQLLNILKGEMSLVGPRPEMPWLVANYEPWQRKRFAVPQGLTGWWQVNGRSDKPMHLNIEYDLYYIQNYSLLLDFQILLRTPWAVLRGKGAF